MPDAEQERLERLADWSRLSPDTVKGVYASLSEGTAAPKWNRLVLHATPPREMLMLALRAAQTGGFLNPFATKLVRLDEDDGERDPDEVARLLGAFIPFGVMQAIVNDQAGMMPARTLKVLTHVCEATGWIEIDKKVTGTAFLVERSDLVLTAGHATLDEESDDAGRRWSMALRPGLSFHFLRSDGSEQTILPAGTKPLSFSLPWGVPPSHLDGVPGGAGAGTLDYALIELAEQVEHGRPLDIRDPGDFRGKMKCFVIGYPGGKQLSWDGDLIDSRDDASARILHRANTLDGMSGGCCVYADGTLIGLHEGTITRRNGAGQPVRDQDGKVQRLNRAVMLAPIRTAQRAGGRDPLESRLRVRALRIADAGAVGRLRDEGARLAGNLAGDWLRAHDALAAGVRAHPWFRRKELEDWVVRLAQESVDRLLFITGERGTGKSFTVEIVAALLRQPRDLLRITPSQVNDWSFDVTMSGLVSLPDTNWRTRDGAVHYDWVPALVAELGKRGDARRSAREPLVITIDFENGDVFRADGSPWRSFIENLVAEPWARLVLIGLSVAERGAIMDQLETNPATSAIKTSLFELRTISSTGASAAASSLTPLLTHFIDMAKANGEQISRDDAMEFLTALREKLPESLRTAPPQLETSLSALLAVGFQRLLDQATGRA